MLRCRSLVLLRGVPTQHAAGCRTTTFSSALRYTYCNVLQQQQHRQQRLASTFTRALHSAAGQHHQQQGGASRVLRVLTLTGGLGGTAALASLLVTSQQSKDENTPLSALDSQPDAPALSAATAHEAATNRPSRIFSALRSLWEALLTALRAGELFLRFAPLVLSYPMVYMGRTYPESGTTWGSIWWYRFLRAQISGAGPSFVKLAQWAASRTDLFSEQLCLELGKLHDSNRPHSAEYSKRRVAEALGVANIDAALEHWEDKPLGAGAVAQVHYARLNPERAQMLAATSDTAVAIKVLHPGVARLIRRDLRIMRWGAQILDMLPGMSWLSMPDEVRVFGDMMEAQVDLRVEAANIHRFGQNFRQRPGVSFPHEFASQSSSECLVESCCDGVPLRAFLDIPGHTPFDRQLGARGLEAFLRMLIYDNFVHADLHPGNIMVELSPPEVLSPLDRFVEDFYDMSPFNHYRRQNADRSLPSKTQAHQHIRQILSDYQQGLISAKEKSSRVHEYMDYLYHCGFTTKLVFLDCGLVTSLDDENRRNFIDLFEAVCTFDGRRAGQLMIDRCLTPDLVVDPEIFVLRIQDIILKVRKVSMQLSKLTFSEIFSPVMSAVRLHHVRLAPDFVNIIMAMFILEGIGRRLDPESDILRVALPMLRTWLAEEAKTEIAWRGKKSDSKPELSSYRARSWNLYKVWLYVEVREYVDRIRDWGYDDREYFGQFSPFITADSSLA
ncbi:hypothetical protein GGI07_001689 [Coemansia sp. Benny D115]|nr:hypothetical protein GGI07_001689 [Coemansia sp. Benny D115]